MNEQTTHEDRGVLRFITAGSVDDGKSTLIGRLLYDSKGIFIDQLASLSRAKHKRTQGDRIDLSLLTDGLEAEREQGITIDVAYRYFATPTRKYIIADTPGHEQYTRNMVTGASTADAAIILIDPTRVNTTALEHHGLLAQTKRHSMIAKLLGLPHIIVAVNKMDLVDYDQNVFEAIRRAYLQLAEKIGLRDVHFIPLSALEGDNVVHGSDKMPWYDGPTLLELLETLSTRTDECNAALRLPVQYVLRTYPEGKDNAAGTEVFGFRGYQGMIESGRIRPGDTVTIQPSGVTATVHEVRVFETPLDEAIAGQSVTVLLKENVDLSRGDMLTGTAEQPTVSRQVVADVCWLDTETLDVRRKYWLKHTSKVTQAKVTAIQFKREMHSLTDTIDAAATLQMNDIARIQVTLQQPIACDAYTDIPGTGSFILIDSTTHQTAAAGMIVSAS
ncbi:MAG: sulfate adenylyltransferase [Burkholderiaceae bacterium]|nr:MAG: sulfate adenylyltransferase [Burkholderiaceae bacterium]